MSSDDLKQMLPPGDQDVQDSGAGLDDLQDPMPDGQEVHAAAQDERKALSDDDRADIAAHIDGLIEAAAQIGADSMPPELRDNYEEAFRTSRMVRGAVTATGIGHALHELMPASGPDGVGSLPAPVQRIHPLARVLLGVLVLGAASAMQRKVVLNAAQQTAIPGAPGAGPAGGSQRVPNGAGLLGGFFGGGARG